MSQLTEVQVAALDALLKTLPVLESKDSLEVGSHGFDFTINVRGTLDKHQDGERKPTVSTPWLTVIALFVRRCGIQREEAMKIVREAMVEAMAINSAKDKESKKKLEALYKATGIEEAKKEYDKEVLSKLPKTKVTGQVRSDALKLEVIE